MRKPLGALSLVVLAGCGYHARFPLPAHIKTFNVETFRNKTLERNLDFEFTQALIHEVLGKTRLRVARPGEGDLVVRGEIEELERHVLHSRRYGEKVEMRHLLYVNVEMFDRQKGRMFFQGKRIVRRAEFSLNRGETPRLAREELVRELARRVVSLAFERWPTQPAEATARAQ